MEVTRAESLNDSPTLIRALSHVLSTRTGTDRPAPELARDLATPWAVPAEVRTAPLPEPDAELAPA